MEPIRHPASAGTDVLVAAVRAQPPLATEAVEGVGGG